MKTHLIMQASALYLGVLGLALHFAPEEMARALGASGEGGAVLGLAAGPYLGMAALNWLGRNAVYGGIFGRPVVFANFFAGWGTWAMLVRWIFDGNRSPLAWLLLVLSAMHIAVFIFLLRARVPTSTN